MNADDFAYLNDGFMPNTLRKDRLRNILNTHGVDYNDDMKKQDLVNIFNKEIVPKREQLRREYLGVPASSSNIEMSTPPKLVNPKGRGRSKSPSHVPVRELSPGRASPRRTASRGKREQTPDLGDKIPSLSASVDAVSSEKKKPSSADADAGTTTTTAPKSPRRRRATRKVEVPTEDVAVTVNRNQLADVKLRAPRGSRKRLHDESEPETSFSSENVFQSKPKRSKAVVNEEVKERHEEIRDRVNNYLEQAKRNLEEVEDVPADDGINVDKQVVQDTVDSIDRVEHEEIELNAPNLSSVSVDEHMEDQGSPVESAEEHEHHEQPEQEQEQEQQQEEQQEDQEEQGQEQDVSVLHAPKPVRIQETDELQTPVRRGFLPSLSKLRASKATNDFAEQLEPYMVATPSPSLSRIESPVGRARFDTVSVIPEITDEAEAEAEAEKAEAEKKRKAEAKEERKRKWRNVRRCVFHFVRTFFSLFFSVLFISVGLATLVGITLFGKWYFDARSEIDFCDATLPEITVPLYPSWVMGSDNIYVDNLQTKVREIMDIVRPECIECPKNANCYANRAFTCRNGYRKRDIQWLPFLDPCVIDPEHRRKLDVFQETVVDILRKNNADAYCNNSAPGVVGSDLFEKLFSKKADDLSDDEFSLLWENALQSLENVYPDTEVLNNQPFQEIQKLTKQNPKAVAEAPFENDAGETQAGQMGRYKNTILISHSQAKITYACKVRLFVKAFIKAHKFVLLATFALLTVSLSFAFLISRKLRYIRKVSLATGNIVNALKKQRLRADSKKGGVVDEFLRSSTLRKDFAKGLVWTDICRSLLKVEGTRQYQREIHGEINEVWEWTL